MSRKNFVFLLWETKSVLIRNMKHHGIMKLLNCARFVLNFISSRDEVVILLSILCPRISYHLPQNKFTYTGTFIATLFFFYLFNKWILPSLKVVVILKLYFASRKDYTTYKKIKTICCNFSDYCLSAIIYLKLKLQVKRQKSQSRSILSYSG